MSRSKDNPQGNDPSAEFKKEGLSPDFDDAQFPFKVAYLGGLNQEDEAWIRARSGNKLIQDPAIARIIVIGFDNISGNIEALKDAYNNDKFIIVVNPSLERLGVLAREHGWDFLVPTEAPEGRFLIGFSKKHTIIHGAPKKIQYEPEAKGSHIFSAS